MIGMSINIVIVLIVSFIILGGVIWLQAYLSNLESKYLGLILPIISLLLSMMVILGYAGYNGIKDFGDITALFILAMLLNIFTIIFIGIYISKRKKYKNKNQIDKMNIQDLK